MDTTTQTNNNNILERYKVSKTFKAFEGNKCPICGDNQLSDGASLNHHIALCSIYFMRHNQIDVDQMVNHVKDDDNKEQMKRLALVKGSMMMDIRLFRLVFIVNSYTRSIIIKHQRQINQMLLQPLSKMSKTQQELISLGLSEYDTQSIAVREGRFYLRIHFRYLEDLEIEVADVRRVIQQSKLITFLTITFFFNEEVLEQDLKENTTIKEYAFYHPLFGRMIYAERPSTRFFISEHMRNFNGNSLPHTPACLPSMIPHIDKYHVQSSEVFNQFTLSLPNLECLRLRCDDVKEHLSMVIELLNRNQIKHMTIDNSDPTLLQCQQLFNAINTNKSLISLKLSQAILMSRIASIVNDEWRGGARKEIDYKDDYKESDWADVDEIFEEVSKCLVNLLLEPSGTITK
ncbi:hypothetical protein DFA_00131 [Cavenderia fasciculata]|uniref:Uncharacterized protein n=1 Tax=Cavenderia fasciculata TaxID=261658 RepID=F4PXP3_CACFS|nr:uncharacterized protein DFA_00131 [Cavenderia fasciculata]EGG19553.1 hypothetical protein DFA_00131 [Cavenderia fasciculata]|eukprot:XP_004357847.1 hypothetical protein DFA_00131 [Cavenderia fasciculata]